MTKKEFVEGTLAETLRCARLDVKKLKLTEDENTVQITFSNGYSKEVCIEADSFAGIVLDVTRKAMY